MKKMKFDVTGVINDFPDIHIGIVMVKGLDNTKPYANMLQLQKGAINSAQQQIGDQPPTNHPHISSWRQLYRSFGTKPGDYRPSAEALIRRSIKSGELPRINTAVDIYNIVSVKHIIPMGGFDIDYIEGTIMLRKSDGGEDFNPLGSSGPEETYEGEVVYADDARILTRRWNFRDAVKTRITEDTKDLVMFLDASPEITVDKVEVAMDEFIELLGDACGGEMIKAIASKENPTITL